MRVGERQPEPRLGIERLDGLGLLERDRGVERLALRQEDAGERLEQAGDFGARSICATSSFSARGQSFAASARSSSLPRGAAAAGSGAPGDGRGNRVEIGPRLWRLRDRSSRERGDRRRDEARSKSKPACAVSRQLPRRSRGVDPRLERPRLTALRRERQLARNLARGVVPSSSIGVKAGKGEMNLGQRGIARRRLLERGQGQVGSLLGEVFTAERLAQTGGLRIDGSDALDAPTATRRR